VNILPYELSPTIKGPLLIIEKAEKRYTTPGALFLQEHCPFEFDGITFNTPEEYYQYIKNMEDITNV
jgi:hypothetical protein